MIINQTEVRRLALDTAANLKFRFDGSGGKAARFTRVSPSFLEHINAVAMRAVTERVNQHGNKGQTLT